MPKKILIPSIVLVLITSGSLGRAADTEKIPAKELPSAILAYAFLFSFYPGDFSRFLESNSDLNFQRALRKLHANLDALKVEIPDRIGFGHDSFLVQSDVKGQTYGSSGLKDPVDGTLFVTTPIRSIDDKTIVIWGPVAPQKTTIFTVDQELKAELIYDSLRKNDKGKLPLASIYQVRVEGQGKFVLKERKYSGIMGGGGGRTVTIDASKEKVVVSFEP